MYLVSKRTSELANSFVAFSKNLVGDSDVVFSEYLGGSSTSKAVSYALAPLDCGGSSACIRSIYNGSNKVFKQIGFETFCFLRSEWRGFYMESTRLPQARSCEKHII